VKTQSIKKWAARIIVLAILVFAVLGYFFVPPIHNALNPIFALFASMNVEALAAYLRSFGVWAVVVSFLLMILQSVAAPLPAFLLTFANAAIRSEERRVGKECLGMCRSRWSPYH
jgi:uncharacterized membrane protein YdjX (TVP38/TMEM64 family)